MITTPHTHNDSVGHNHSPAAQAALARLDQLAAGLIHVPILKNHGTIREDVPVAAQRGELGRCYHNAITLAMNSPGRLHYTEGLVVHLKTGFVLEHAWVEDKNGTPLETTWPSTAGWVYLGMRFTLEELLDALHDEEGPIFADDWARGYPLLRAHTACCPVAKLGR